MSVDGSRAQVGNKIYTNLVGWRLAIVAKPSQEPYLGAERGCRDIKEGGGALRGHGLGQHRLARAWWSVCGGERSTETRGPGSFRLQSPHPNPSLYSYHQPSPSPSSPSSFFQSLSLSLCIYILPRSLPSYPNNNTPFQGRRIPLK